MKTQAHILIVDDEPDIRQILKDILSDEGYRISLAEDANAANRIFKESIPDLVLLDIWMPKEDGISVLKNWKSHQSEQFSQTPIIMISGHGTVENAVEAVKLGAYDFLEKPLSTGKLLLSVKRGLENASLKQENQRLKFKLHETPPIIAKSDSSQVLMRHIQLLGPTDSWVFITGEVGSGKRLVAKMIHQNSPRSESDFHEINLAAIPSEAVAQHLFGQEAQGKTHQGYFELTKQGTLCINEVLDLNLQTQNKLFSALQDKKYMRINGTETLDFDVRIIATTSGNVEKAINQNQFRQDLFYLLNVIPIEVPSLRQREQDLPDLIQFFIHNITSKNNLPAPQVSDAALQALQQYHWPGNVRQLQNILQRILLLNEGNEITQHEVELALRNELHVQKKTPADNPDYFNLSIKQAKEKFEYTYLKYHLKNTRGNISELAKRIGLERTHLYRKLKNLNIDIKDAK